MQPDPATERKKKPREEWDHNCIAHCTACDAHFTGLAPFDAHRENGECVDPGTVRFGEKSSRAGQPVLQAIKGRCDKLHGSWKDGKRLRWEEGIDLWQMSVSEADERQAVLW